MAAGWGLRMRAEGCRWGAEGWELQVGAGGEGWGLFGSMGPALRCGCLAGKGKRRRSCDEEESGGPRAKKQKSDAGGEEVLGGGGVKIPKAQGCGSEQSCGSAGLCRGVRGGLGGHFWGHPIGRCHLWLRSLLHPPPPRAAPALQLRLGGSRSSITPGCWERSRSSAPLAAAPR